MNRSGCLTDVPGVAVGHHQRIGRGWCTGTTVVLLPDGCVAGVDVRGGGPGTRETDLLSPTATIPFANAICLTGGSAFGLAAAGGVMSFLESKGIGFPVGQQPSEVVPIVPGAVIFDLGRGGAFANRPDESFGRRAAAAARCRAFANGSIGAGVGTLSKGLQGGIGTASVTLPSGTVVSALAVVNSAGSVIDPESGLPWMPGAERLRHPPADQRAALRQHFASTVPALNTTIGVVATTAALTKAQCSRFATVAHDGMARAIRPVHSLLDGDVVFGVATGRDQAPPPADPALTTRARLHWLNAVFEAGAEAFAAACTNAVVEAVRRGTAPAYRDLCPGAYTRFPNRALID
ncbi:MAG: P1 family peptidase [Actinomycetota bacterium]|nr:P1 family peptidase [Actinomycetota bacterium]